MPTAPSYWDEVFDPAFADADSLLPFRAVAHALAARAEVVLDVGCGRGAWVADGVYRPLEDLRGPGRRVVGIDVDPNAQANRTIDEFHLIDPAGGWPIPDASVDLAVSDWVIEHVVDPRAFVAELTRVLRPGGAFVARSVSRHSLLALAARAVPNHRHADVVARLQPGRQAADVFPTAYRMNSKKALAELLDRDYDWSVSHRGGLNHYFHPWPRFARVVAACEPRLPKPLRTSIVVYARKK